MERLLLPRDHIRDVLLKISLLLPTKNMPHKSGGVRTTIPCRRKISKLLRSSLAAYLQGRDVYVLDAAAGADPEYRMPIQVVTELAWHNLFARHLFLRANESDLTSDRPGFTILCVPNFHTDPRVHGTRSETAIIIDFEERLVLIAGTQYAGEMKKSIFTILNFILPPKGVLPMHCSANVGPMTMCCALLWSVWYRQNQPFSRHQSPLDW